MMHPNTVYQAKDIPGGNVPELTRPRTFINVSNGNFQSVLTLPSNQKEGTRIVVQSSAEWGFTVLANNMSYSIANGEIVAFKVDENHIWNKETITIDLLLVYSDKAAARLGESVMRNRLIEAFNLTNDALENSGANFRYRMRGLNKITAKDSWKTLGDPLSDLRSDPTVQGWRDSLKADGVYYEGTEDGCGLAWVKASSFNMVATGSINCGTTVMRHELGHNMGLQHAGESSSYNQGYGLLGTIMGGNALPYYATPYRYTLDYGTRVAIKSIITSLEKKYDIKEPRHLDDLINEDDQPPISSPALLITHIPLCTLSCVDMLYFIDKFQFQSSHGVKLIVLTNRQTRPLAMNFFSQYHDRCFLLDDSVSLNRLSAKVKILLERKYDDFHEESPCLKSPLSPREHHVIQSLIKGTSIWHIANALGLNYKTISHYKVSALRKLGFRNINALFSVNQHVGNGAALINNHNRATQTKPPSQSHMEKAEDCHGR